ncbi:MAG: hypothetical protein R2699_02275 [Acidimicrobiales bacterium]
MTTIVNHDTDGTARSVGLVQPEGEHLVPGRCAGAEARSGS